MLCYKKLQANYFFILLIVGLFIYLPQVSNAMSTDEKSVLAENISSENLRYIPDHIAQIITEMSSDFHPECSSEAFQKCQFVIAHDMHILDYTTLKAAIDCALAVLAKHDLPADGLKASQDLNDYAQEIIKIDSSFIPTTKELHEIKRKHKQFCNLCAKKIISGTICACNFAVDNTLTANKAIFNEVIITGSLSAPCAHLSCNDGGQMPLPPLPTDTFGSVDVMVNSIPENTFTRVATSTNPLSMPTTGTYLVTFTGYLSASAQVGQNPSWDVAVRLSTVSGAVVAGSEVHTTQGYVVPAPGGQNILVTTTHLVSLVNPDLLTAEVQWTVVNNTGGVFSLPSGTLTWVKLSNN